MLRINKEQAKAFMKILYSFCMIDRNFSVDEEEYLTLIANNIFGLDDFSRVCLTKMDIENVFKSLPNSLIQYSFLSIASDLLRYTKKTERNEQIQLIKAMSGTIELSTDQINQLKSLLEFNEFNEN